MPLGAHIKFGHSHLNFLPQTPASPPTSSLSKSDSRLASRLSRVAFLAAAAGWHAVFTASRHSCAKNVITSRWQGVLTRLAAAEIGRGMRNGVDRTTEFLHRGAHERLDLSEWAVLLSLDWEQPQEWYFKVAIYGQTLSIIASTTLTGQRSQSTSATRTCGIVLSFKLERCELWSLLWSKPVS